MTAAKSISKRGVIFDLFHTLTGLESERSDLPSTSYLLGIDRKLWDELLTNRSRSRLTGEQQDPYAIITALVYAAGVSIPEERIREAVRIRIRRFRDSLMRIPKENVETLMALRRAGLRLGVISNADVMEVAAWPESPLAELFDATIFSCTAGCVKPEPAIYVKCLDALALSADQCLYVGDGGSNELTGAKEVGLSTVFISRVVTELWPDRVPERLSSCDYHVERVPNILGLLGLA